jgi:hypothetical protein
MVAIRSTAFSLCDLCDNVQNSFALLRCVWDQLVLIRIRDDPVRRTRPEFIFDENAISHELHEIGNATSRWAAARLDFDRDETIGRVDEIVGLPGKATSA